MHLLNAIYQYVPEPTIGHRNVRENWVVRLKSCFDLACELPEPIVGQLKQNDQSEFSFANQVGKALNVCGWSLGGDESAPQYTLPSPYWVGAKVCVGTGPWGVLNFATDA